jgi:Na+-translocating ferredoxin:NAD+ oxidoreductase subunit C
MNAIIEFTNRLLKGALNLDTKAEADVFKFNGGVHPPDHKSESNQLPIAQLKTPNKIVLPLRQHIGNLPKLCVEVGDRVRKGQLIAEAEGNISAAIHAPTSGHITAISEEIIPHPSGLTDHCITMIPDGLDEWITKRPIDWQNTPKHELVAQLRNSGIVGLGGATFPTHIKLRSDGKSNIHTLIINAAECEPYITCDDMLMRERAAEIAQGIQIAKHLLGVDECYIGIEDNKPIAHYAMTRACESYGFTVKTVPTLYPSGDARRLIHLLLGVEIPFNKRSTDIGVQVFNVATVLAIYRYFEFGEPSINRIITMTGAVKQAQNFEVLFGTPLSELVEAAGGASHDTTHFIMGGPMMGFDLPLADVPLTKAANCIIAATPTLFEAPPPAMPCIRCSRCADACPVNLQPQELYWFAKSNQFEKARDYHLFDCIECGCCTYVCPSNIPLVQYYRYGKSEIIAADKAKEAADIARERNEFRLARIEREKEERAQKHAERAAAAKAKKAEDLAKAEAAAKSKNVTEANSTEAEADKARKQAAIAAAIERAKTQKLAASESGKAPRNTTEVSAHVQAEINAIDAARQKAETLFTQPSPSSSTTSQDAKQAKIQEAIARARANKLAADQAKDIAPKIAIKNPTPEVAITQSSVAKSETQMDNETLKTTTQQDEKQAKIQAAIARARANKLAADQAKGITPKASGENESDIDSPKPVIEQAKVIESEAANQTTTPQDAKQAKIQAAIARARANKLAADQAKTAQLNNEPTEDD